MTGFDPSTHSSSQESREAARQIAAAHEARKFGNLDEALQRARRAHDLDPHSGEAAQLVRDLRQEKMEVESWERKNGGGKRKVGGVFTIIVHLILVLLAGILFLTGMLRIGPDTPVDETLPVPTITLTPSLTASPTPTQTPVPPTQTPLPTITPTSIFENPWTFLMQNQPEGVRPLFLIDDSQAEFTGPEGYWVVDREQNLGKAVGGSLHKVNQPSEEPAEAIFRLDRPLVQGGRYEIFISDPAVYCGSDANAYRFGVGKTGENGLFIEFEPIIGTNHYRYRNAAEQRYSGTSWASLGIYQYDPGDVIEVRFNPTGQVKDPDVACMDAVLIGSVPSLPDVREYQLFSQNSIDPQNIVFWTDDQDFTTELSPLDGWKVHEPGSWNWLGDQSKEYNKPLDPLPQITWKLAHPLMPGKYQIYAWVSENQLGKAVYEINLQRYPQQVFQNVLVDLGGRLPALQLLGEVQIDGLPDSASSNKISIIMKPEEKETSGRLAGDVILFIRIP